MIPIRLTIEGMYSYQEAQTIEFGPLMDAGLFGIFGAVGSGKSTILEAIAFALYGEIDRLNKNDRGYNMMNLKSAKMVVDFEFYNFSNERYRAVRVYKRNKKQYTKITLDSAVIYAFEGEEWVPTDKNIIDIIGLSYNNFKRTIIIPQGKFKEFIDLTGRERTEMMMEIFQLHKYDLSEELKLLQQHNKEKLNQLEGQLLQVNLLDADAIQALETQRKQLQIDTTQQQQEVVQLQNTISQYKSLEQDFKDLEDKKKQLNQLLSQKEAFKKLAQHLQEYQQLKKEFGDLLTEEDKQIINQNRLQNQLVSEQNALQQILKQVDAFKQQVQIHLVLQGQIPAKQKELQQWESFEKLSKWQAKYNSHNASIEKGKAYLLECENQKKRVSLEIEKLSVQIQQEKHLLIGSAIFTEAAQWFTQSKNNSESLKNIESDLAGLQKKIADNTNSLHEIAAQQEGGEEYLAKEYDAVNQQKQQIQTRIRELEVEKGLAKFAHQLQEGCACPLCGSVEHPKVLEPVDVLEELTTLQQQILQLEGQAKAWENKLRTYQQVSAQIQFLSEQEKNLVQRQTELSKRIQEHQTQFLWGSYFNNEQEFTAKRLEEEKRNKFLKEYENNLSNLTQELDKQNRQLALAAERLQKLQFEQQESAGIIREVRQQLDPDFLTKNETTEAAAAKQQIENISKEIENFAIQSEVYKAKELELTGMQSKQQAIVELLQNQHKEAQQNVQAIQQKCQELLAETTYSDINAVRGILQQSIDVEDTVRKIQQFQTNVHSLTEQVNQLEQKLTGKFWSQEVLNEWTQKLEKLQEVQQQTLALFTEIKIKLDQQKRQVEVFAKLAVEKQQLEKKAENLVVLNELFKGKGFVNYMSSIYLRNLCEMANVRFRRLTHFQMSLQLNEDNEFEVVDYLNNGKTRSVKTLSGGQSFQVALSLSLALAESVQSLSKAGRNFFFLDEGFGTLDEDAMETVFETLTQLNAENRIVGIISHVDILKERMPVYLQIEKDNDTGSQIKWGRT